MIFTARFPPLLLLFSSTLVFAAEKPVKLFLLGGQSNMDSCGRWQELPEEMKESPAKVRIWDNRKLEWKKLGERAAATPRRALFGPEVVFSHRMAAAFPGHEIRLVKTSAGGTSLANSWLPEKNKMYARFTANYRNARLVQTDDLTTLKDNTHFDTAGQSMLGERMAAQMLDALEPVKK